MENYKVISLRLNKGNFDVPANIIPEGNQELEWWLLNTDKIEKSITLPSTYREYFCYWSSYSCGPNFDKHKTGGAGI